MKSTDILTPDELATIKAGKGKTIPQKTITDDMTKEQKDAAKAYNKALKHELSRYRWLTPIGEQLAAKDPGSGSMPDQKVEWSQEKLLREQAKGEKRFAKAKEGADAATARAEARRATSARTMPAHASFGPFSLAGTTLQAGGQTFDLGNTMVQFISGGKEKRFTATRLTAGAVTSLVAGPIGLLGLKRKNLKAFSIIVADTAGQSFAYDFKKKDAIEAQKFVMQVEAVQAGL